MASRIFSITSISEARTSDLARHFAASLPGGSCLGLSGTLGAGKSVFARGIARGLGIQGIINSPSYPIILEYPGSPGFCHMDWYRLGSLEEIEETGAYEYLENPDWVCLVEWWNKFPDCLGSRLIAVNIAITGPGERRLEFTIPEAMEDCLGRLAGLGETGMSERGTGP